VPLTPRRSIAVDPRYTPLGAPVYLATTLPNSDAPLARLMFAQDTGGAIRGPVRADFFWGFGAEAGALAGRMRQQGMMWVLLPQGYPLPKP
jgi:membrane-bound lytic murein transglycosylase A